VIEGSAEADKHLVEIIKKKLRVGQLSHTSDRPFADLRGPHNGIEMANSSVPLHKSGQLLNVVVFKHHARLVVRIPMRLILGNQRAAI
jgi:hypothetical protein